MMQICKEDYVAFEKFLQNTNRGALRILSLVAILGVPAFGILDYIVIPAHFTFFITMRLICVVIGLFLFGLTFTKGGLKYCKEGGVLIAWCVGFMIAIMVRYYGGYLSPYYAGINLVILVSTLIFTWEWWWINIMSIPLYLSYLIPTLLFDSIDNLQVFIAHNFFMVFTIIFITIAQHFNFVRRRELFFANLQVSRAKARLEEANEKLKELDQAKNQFFANITHELRTPLTLILAPVEGILNGDLGNFSPSQIEYFKDIFKNGIKLLKLINDLLDLAKLTDSRIRLRIEEIDLVLFLKNLSHIITPLANRKNIEVHFFSELENCLIWGDRVQLERVFLNILSNSIKFTPKSGKVQIELIEQKNSVIIKITDTGIGIPHNQLEKIFDRFSQVDSSITRRFSGTGIGLALARELINLHGGSIYAESKLNEGTSMVVTLLKGNSHFDSRIIERRAQGFGNSIEKRREEDYGIYEWMSSLMEKPEYRLIDIDSVTEKIKVDKSEDVGLKQARILIVEDNPDMLQFLNFTLKEFFEIFTAENGEIGLNLVIHKKPDLVISDVMMPIIDGYTLCKKIKESEETKHIPVVLLTAKVDIKDRVEGQEVGADEYLTKPFSIKELLSVIRKLLKSRNIYAELLLKDKIDSLENFSARISHEINNPLNFIKNGVSAIEVLLERLQRYLKQTLLNSPEILSYLDTQRNEMLQLVNVINKGVERIGNIVNFMKEYSREGYKHRILQECNLKEIIFNSIQAIYPVLNKEIELHYDLPDKESILAYPEELQQLFTNILQNAFDAIPQKGDVWIQSKNSQDRIDIIIKDNGEGIKEEDLPRVFNPFFTTKPVGKGMGLGLYICYQTVKKFNGNIKINSKEGEGTEVTISFNKL